MSDYDELYRGPTVAPAHLEVETFQEEVFTRLDDADPIPDPNHDFGQDNPPDGPPPDPFEEFEVDKKPISRLLEDFPSLEGLFKPFDLASENPEANTFDDMYEYTRPSDFVYEDMDLRDPDVVRTLARAEEILLEKTKKAQEEAARIIEAAETEAAAMVREAEAEARARAETVTEEARLAAEKLLAQAAADRAEAEEFLARARAAQQEAEEKLAAASDRIANLDNEKQTAEADIAARQKALEEERAQVMAEIEAKRQTIWDEAEQKAYEEGLSRGLTQGLTEGHNRGYAEASEKFQEKVAGFLPIMEKMDKLYDDLWAANGPMMIKLAIEAAEQILNKELSQARDLTVRAFEACIDYLAQANKVIFWARPQDIAALEEAKAEYRQRLGALVSVTFKPEETLGPGDLIMESDVGRLDATIKHRTAQVMDVLRQAYRGHHGRALEPGAGPPPDDGAAGDIIEGELVTEGAEASAPPLEGQPLDPLEGEGAAEALAEAQYQEAAPAEPEPEPEPAAAPEPEPEPQEAPAAEDDQIE